ncbi:MAG TPA: hypothetical protein VF881_20275 [Polyangiaceae bacterium]
MMRTLVVVVAFSSALGACSRKEDAAPKPIVTASANPVAMPPPASPPPAAAPVRPVVWTDPPGWQRVAPTSPMRKASYKIPAAPKDPEDAEMAVFAFGSEGGSIEDNIQRWTKQFPDAKPGDVKRSERQANGMTQTIVELEGTYSSGMPGAAPTPKSNFRMVGAVVETPGGKYFFKLTGPKKTVEAARSAFFTLLDSVKPS